MHPTEPAPARSRYVAGGLVLLALAALLHGRVGRATASPAPAPASPAAAPVAFAKVTVSGAVNDRHREAVGDCRITVLVDGTPVKAPPGGFRSGEGGGYRLDFELPLAQAERGRVALVFERTTFRRLGPVEVPGLHRQPGPAAAYVAHLDVALDRARSAAFWVALLVLIAIYVLIAAEVMHRTLAALLGASVVLVLTYTVGHFDPDWVVITFPDAMRAIDWNVIFLLFGMMIIVGILKHTGLFQWLAFKSFQVARGKVYVLSVIMMFVTAITSAFLDNVTTMLLLTPVAIEICVILKLHPFSLLLPLVLASNFGGTATLIGDPPNIMIGSFAGLTFNDFAVKLTPVVLIVMVAQALMSKLWYRKEYRAAQLDETALQRLFVSMETRYSITDRKLMWLGLGVLGVVIGMFILHGALHMEVSVAALLGAAALLCISGKDLMHILEKDVEWSSLVFFMMLFIVVGAAAKTGLLQVVADWVLKVSGGDLVVAILVIAWVSAILSAVIDNIPFTATMLPIVAYMTKNLPGAESMVLFWALSLGACFGGNGTLVGASANIVTAGLLEKAGYPVSFRTFLKVGMPFMLMSMIIASIYLLLVLK
ncbi:MAG: ArsB/NhaD family transporter [Deltaproteobacteria bacterium]|nr:ArsB/NhaD family transporter [Deltaproteobacteria bacterium]